MKGKTPHFVATFVKFCVMLPRKFSVFPRRNNKNKLLHKCKSLSFIIFVSTAYKQIALGFTTKRLFDKLSAFWWSWRFLAENWIFKVNLSDTQATCIFFASHILSSQCFVYYLFLGLRETLGWTLMIEKHMPIEGNPSKNIKSAVFECIIVYGMKRM